MNNTRIIVSFLIFKCIIRNKKSMYSYTYSRETGVGYIKNNLKLD